MYPFLIGKLVSLGIISLGIIFVLIGGLLVTSFKLTDFTIEVPVIISGYKDWIYESFTVLAGEHVYRDRLLPNDSMVTVEYNITLGGGISILIVDEEDYLRWLDGEEVHSPFPGGEGAVKASILFWLPHEGRWFFVWNNDSPFGVSEVSANVTWTGNVVEYREVTTSRPVQEQYLALIGSLFLIIGIVIVVFGLVGLFRTTKVKKGELDE